MDNYLNLREIYLKQNTDLKVVIKSTSCNKNEYVLMYLIDKLIYLFGVIVLIILGAQTAKVGLLFLFIILFTIFCITFKLWCPRTIGMRVFGLVYVNNYNFLPLTRKNSMTLYTPCAEYTTKYNKQLVGDFKTDNTSWGFSLQISGLYTEYHQNIAMMTNGIYLVKQKVYNVFKEDYITSGKIQYSDTKVLKPREDSPILKENHDQIFKNHEND